MASFIMKNIVARPLVTAFGIVGGCEVVSSSLTYLVRSIPIEIGDPFSVLIGVFSTALYYTKSARVPGQTALLSCVTAWGLRLSSFLLRRTLRGFHDDRLDKLRSSAAGAATWCIAQTIWIFGTLLPVWVGMPARAQPKRSLGLFEYVALTAFVVGFVFEAVGDYQKASFVAAKKSNDVTNMPPFCNSGLFALCRFPNYFGEFCMWTSLSALSFLLTSHWTRWLLPICPVFSYSLFHKVSIPLAVEKMENRLSEDDYKRWCRIPLFFPFIGAQS